VAEPEVLALRQEMTIARDEFVRLLPAAVDQADLCVDGNEIRPCGGDRAWRIVLCALDDLCVGALRLPRHRVEIFLRDADPGARDRFLARFELHYRRAGG
jgi:hypothetical protein